MQGFDSLVEVPNRPVPSAGAVSSPACTPTLHRGRDMVKSLPPPPTTLLRVLDKLSQPDLSGNEAADLIKSDPALVAELLRVANSAFYGMSTRVTSVTKAVTMLGTRRTLSLAVGVATMTTTSKLRFPVGFDHAGLWDHLQATARATLWLLGDGEPEIADRAYVAAILHDVGKALYAAMRPEDWRRIDDAVSSRPITFHEAERELGGLSHAEMGALLLAHWQLPAELCELVGRHHEPISPDEPRADASCVLRTADALARISGIGNPGDRQAPSLAAAAADDGHRSPEEIEMLACRLREAGVVAV